MKSTIDPTSNAGHAAAAATEVPLDAIHSPLNRRWNAALDLVLQ